MCRVGSSKNLEFSSSFSSFFVLFFVYSYFPRCNFPVASASLFPLLDRDFQKPSTSSAAPSQRLFSGSVFLSRYRVVFVG